MPALTRPIIAMTVSIITNVPLRPIRAKLICLARKNGRRLAASQLYEWFIASYLGTTGAITECRDQITAAYAGCYRSPYSFVENVGDAADDSADYHFRRSDQAYESWSAERRCRNE